MNAPSASSAQARAYRRDDPRVLVLQLGARLHYGVPAVYARHGALAALYTDATASKGALRVADHLVPRRMRGKALQRLLGRVLPAELPRELVEVETLATLVERVALKLRVRSEALSATHERLRERILAADFRGANCVYSVDNGDLPLLLEAKRRGLTVLYEQIINPSVGRTLREERERFPGVEAQDSEALVEEGIRRDSEVFQLADKVICASDFVRDDIRALAGNAPDVEVVPYGVEEGWLSAPAKPVPGRVLFVGSVGLRKGTHYLAEATRLLRARGVACDVQVVGPYDAAQLRSAAFNGPNYLGQIPRTQVRGHFAAADVFVLPTLSEGFGLVHLEALALGVPVITTPNCGSVVRDGVDGYIVPVRDARALAERIEQVITNRGLRETLSKAAKSRAAEFTWSRFGERLMNATRAAVVRGPVR